MSFLPLSSVGLLLSGTAIPMCVSVWWVRSSSDGRLLLRALMRVRTLLLQHPLYPLQQLAGEAIAKPVQHHAPPHGDIEGRRLSMACLKYSTAVSCSSPWVPTGVWRRT